MTNTNRPVKVRFPPSPTGEVHIGNVRTLLFNFFFARQNGGKIVFRFEDTDTERSKREYEEPILKALSKLGLSWDEGPYRQTDRNDIYVKYIKLLVENDLAYEAEENKKDGKKVIRLRNFERDIAWNDLVKGEIKINTHTFKSKDENGEFSGEGNPDIIIARNINDPIYHFTVVIDDWLMEVTHVIRGDDHITSTPRQIMILEALQKLEEKIHEENIPKVIIPEYAHLPTIVGDDGKKLSKRKGNTSLQKFFDFGYLPETMTNYLALLGWNPGDDREFFTIDELIKEFSFARCQVSPAKFDYKKLDNINKHYLLKLSDNEYIDEVLKYFSKEEKEFIQNNFNINKKVILKVLRERVSKGVEVVEAYRNGEVNMFFQALYNMDFKNFDINKICFKGQSLDEAKNNLKLVLEKIVNVSPENWNIENLKNVIWDWSAIIGRGQTLHPLRTILSLKDKSPDPFTIMEIIEKEESIRRIKNIL